MNGGQIWGMTIRWCINESIIDYDSLLKICDYSISLTLYFEPKNLIFTLPNRLGHLFGSWIVSNFIPCLGLYIKSLSIILNHLENVKTSFFIPLITFLNHSYFYTYLREGIIVNLPKGDFFFE